MTSRRLALQLVAVIGAFVLAGLGHLDADAAIGFVGGALVVPSATDAVRREGRR